MSAIHDILNQIKDTQDVLATYSSASFAPEDAFATRISRKSIEKRLAILEDQLAEVAAASEKAVLDYRIFSSEGEEIKMGTVGRAMANFQTFFSTVFDGLLHGPKLRANFDASVEERSAFKFVDAYQGSAGLLFTIQNPTELISTRVEEAMANVVGIIKSGDSDAISKFAKRFGAAAVRKLYEWTNDHAMSAVGANLKWQTAHVPRINLEIGLDRFAQLKNTIAEASDERIELIDSYGLLVGANTETRIFDMRFPSGNHVKGHISEQVPKEKFREIDKSYRVKLQRRTVVHYAADKETIEHTLLDLS